MKRTPGYLSVIAGPMYCGKTEELIRLAKRWTIAKKHIQIFKHAVDVRYGKDEKLYSHAGMTFAATAVSTPAEILKKIHKDTQFVGIDEAQFFDTSLVDCIDELVERGIWVVISGLAMTYDRQPFNSMPLLMAKADSVTKLSAICSLCGEEAVFHKKIDGDSSVDPLTADPSLVTGLHDNVFEARCRLCYDK